MLLLDSCAEKLVDVFVAIVDQKNFIRRWLLVSYEELSNEVLLIALRRSEDNEGEQH
jgi:hypothetical protein